MDQLARDFAEQAHFLFVYVREAHPDMFPTHPEHRSIEQKFQQARDMQQKFNTPRPILIDDLDGGVHRVYGGLPNMSWIIDHTGRIAYKAAWTVEDDIRAALEDVLRVREVKRQAASNGSSTREFYKEMISLPAPRSEREPGQKALAAWKKEAQAAHAAR